MMAAPPDPAQSRKRVATYGKSRKLLPNLTQVSPQKPTYHSGDISSRDASSLDSTPRLSPERPSINQSHVPTPKRPRSADVFDVPSSDEDEMPKNTVNPKRSANIQGGPVFAMKNEGQRRVNPMIDAKRRKIAPTPAAMNTEGSRPVPPEATSSRPIVLGDNRSKSSSSEKYKSKAPLSIPLTNKAATQPKQPSNSQSSILAPVAVPVREKLIPSKPKNQASHGLVPVQRPKPITKPTLEVTKERKLSVTQPSTAGLSPSKATARPPSNHDNIRPKVRKVVPTAKNDKSPVLQRNTAPISATAKALLKPESSIYDIDDSSADEAVKPRKTAPIMKAKKPLASSQKPFISAVEPSATKPLKKQFASAMEQSPVKLSRKPFASAMEQSPIKLSQKPFASTMEQSPIKLSQKPSSSAMGQSPVKLSQKPFASAIEQSPVKLSQKPFASAVERSPAKPEVRPWDIDESSDEEDTLMIPSLPSKKPFTMPILDHEPQLLPIQNPVRPGSARKRLIDSFAEPFAQSFDASSSSESEDESVDTSTASPTESQQSIIHQSYAFEEQDSHERIENPAVGIAEPSGSQTRRPRMTYGSSRSMLADQAMDFSTPMFTDLEMDDASKRRARRAVVPVLKPLQNMHEDPDGLDDSQSKADIRSLHELKQAGAKSRIVTNVEHLLADIGVPGTAAISQRRSGLLDLSTRLLDKDFRREFLENGLETGLFMHLGMEEDTIAGFMLVSSLLVCLHDSFRPHTVQQLQQQGLAKLMIRQINKTSTVQATAKERSSNMSKIAQQLLAEYQSALLQAEIWEDTKPQVVTPRAITLRCLELTVRKTREAGISTDVMSKELSSKLFSILQSFEGDIANNANTDASFVEFQLALSTLNCHSVRAMTNRDEEIWITDYLPIISDVLQRVLANTQADFGLTQILALGLTLNVTNNNPKACNCFANKGLLQALGDAIVTNFNLLSGFLIEDERLKVVDNVIMILGVLINFAEWSGTSRSHIQSFKDTPADPLEQFIRIFLENQAKTAEANSIEESHQNVAFGYLAVLLGFLSISAPILRRVQKAQPNRTLRPLLSSIEEFISYWKQVEDQMPRGDDEGQEPTQGLAARLQRMVDQLREMSGGSLSV